MVAVAIHLETWSGDVELSRLLVSGNFGPSYAVVGTLRRTEYFCPCHAVAVAVAVAAGVLLVNLVVLVALVALVALAAIAAIAAIAVALEILSSSVFSTFVP